MNKTMSQKSIGTKITFCDCYSHGIIVEPADPEESEIYLSSWYHGHRDLNIFDRIRTAWEALHGDVRTECLVLEKEATDQLIEELQKAREAVWGKP